MIEDEPPLLTMDEVAQRLKVEKSWLYRQTSLKRLRVHKVGKYSRFYWHEILEDLEQMQKKGRNSLTLAGRPV